MDFIDLSSQQKRLREKIEANINIVLSHGQYIMGPEVKQLEQALAAYVGCRYAIGCSSGTDALVLGLMAYGVKPGDAIFTTPFTFIATAEVISLLGAIPVFVDVDPKTFNFDPQQLDKAIAALKKQDFDAYPLPECFRQQIANLRGIIAVDLFGLPADYDIINKMAKDHDLFVIEDAAQSFGAEYLGKRACSLAEIGCTSFFPAKPLGCYGDGGMCFTDNEGLAGTMDSIRVHGKGNDKYENIRIGINGRLDTLQAGILLAKLEIFEEEIEKRQEVAHRYTEFLGGNGHITTPITLPGIKSAWAQYSVLFETAELRKASQARMKNAGIPTGVYYPKPLHLQPAFAHLAYREGDFPISEDLSKRILSLPMHPYLTLEDQDKVIRTMLSK
jgi:dTDP-4-amino-4,6-dideoxygalactose transaminase